MQTKITINLKDIKSRVMWQFKPTNRVKPSKKIYSRKNIKDF